MNQSHKQQWLQKLRDPATKRCKNRLKYGECRCAVGWLCEIVDPNAWTGGKWGYGSEADPITVYGKNLEKLGLTTKQLSTVITMSDGGKPFTAIADYVEKEC